MTNFPPIFLPLLAKRWYEDESRGFLCDTPGVNHTLRWQQPWKCDTGSPKRGWKDAHILTGDEAFVEGRSSSRHFLGLSGTRSPHVAPLQLADPTARPPGLSDGAPLDVSLLRQRPEVGVKAFPEECRPAESRSVCTKALRTGLARTDI